MSRFDRFFANEDEIKYRTDDWNTFVDDSGGYQKPQVDDSLLEKISRLKEVISKLEQNLIQSTSNFYDKGYKIDYASELNLQQLEAVKTIEGKTLVIAGAGSGKTRALTYRTSFLLENNISSEAILILTFTKKAAGEIKNRVNQLLGSEQLNITSGTFHSFCNMLLARYSKVIGITPKFTILDQQDSRDLLDLLKRQSRVKKKEEIPFPKKATLQNIVSTSKNRRKPIDQIIDKNYSNFKCYTHEILELSRDYHSYKRNNNLYDYDDLIDEVIRHLKINQEFKDFIQRRYKHIMVDEYQDTNLPQKELVDILAEREDSSLMVVGDDNQSIYGFRGANYQNILLFGETFANAKLIKLEENYRSTSNILNFINDVSNKIALGYKKSLFTTNKRTSSKPEFTRLSTEEKEAKYIADKIMELHDRIDYKGMAVLCRAAFHSNFVQAEFLKRKIPFIVVGGIKFIEKRHIKDVLAYMKILWNPLDTISWHRVLMILPGIGSTTANKITQEIEANKGDIRVTLKDSSIKKNEITTLYKVIIEMSEVTSLIEVFQIVESYYIPLLKNIEEDWSIRVEDFKILKRLCVEYKELEEFLSSLALDPPNDSSLVFTTEHAPKDNSVTISTIHSAKGLEWNTVFFISLIDGAVPYYKSFDDFEQLEEERKLFYVACSRAKENLYLTAPSYFATYAGFFHQHSRFIDEANIQHYKQENY